MEKSSDNTSKKKKTMGRRKIEMKKIEKKSSLQVAFSKRRGGLFKKASELSVLCGCEIAILVQSPAEKMYAFRHPSADSTIQRFLTNDDSNCGGEEDNYCDDSSILEYAEALKKIQLENNNKNNQEKDGGVMWFDRSIEGMDMDDLEEYLEGLQGLLGNVQNRLTEINKNNNGAVMVNPQTHWCLNGLNGNVDLKKLSDEIFEGMSDEDIYAAVMMVPPIAAARCSTSPCLEGLVGYYNKDVNHEMEKLSRQSEVLMSNSVENDHGGLSSSSSLLMARNNDIFKGMSNDDIYAAIAMDPQAAHWSPSPSLSSSSTLAMAQNNDIDDIYAALTMDLQAAHCSLSSSSSSSSSSRIGGSRLEMAKAQNDDHNPLPLLQNDESIEELINWCHENIDFCL